jgi:DNA-binding response OmpR family regulator
MTIPHISLVCVDREKLTLGILTARFKYIGWTVRYARSAQEAFLLLRESIPDVLVTEIQLEASNGYSLIRDIRKDTNEAIAQLPIIILSHMAQSDDILRGIHMGANGYVSKPFDLIKLEEEIVLVSGSDV